jgi:Na+/H+-translocating membrane pyrophosphatase
MILGATLSHEAGFSHQYKVTFMLFPLVVHCLDIFSSTVGMFFVRTTPGLPGYDAIYGALEDPTLIMKRAYKISMIVGACGFLFICHQFLNAPKTG